MPPIQCEIAPDERLVEAHLLAQRRERLGRGVEAEHQLRRIAGQDFQHRKDDERRDEQRRDADAAGVSGGRRAWDAMGGIEGRWSR